MRYIILTIFCLSLPVEFLAAQVSRDENDTARTLQQKLQHKIGKEICNPEQALHLPPFN